MSIKICKKSRNFYERTKNGRVFKRKGHYCSCGKQISELTYELFGQCRECQDKEMRRRINNVQDI